MEPKLHVETHGSGSTTIVVCNGLSQSTANWRGIAREDRHYRWVLFDAAGHGKSDLGETPYSLDGHVANLLRALKISGAERPVLMGFSHGARVALRAAAQHADQFTAMVLVSCGATTPPRRRAIVRSWLRCLELGGVAAMAWASLPTIIGRKILEKFDDLELLVKGTVARNQEAGLLATLQSMQDYPETRRDAERVNLPTLVLQGGEDPLIDAGDAQRLAEWIQGGQVRYFQDCGHTLPLEEPARFLQTVAHFLDVTIARHATQN
jgi:3-oxoadipate enol-lactonase